MTMLVQRTCLLTAVPASRNVRLVVRATTTADVLIAKDRVKNVSLPDYRTRTLTQAHKYTQCTQVFLSDDSRCVKIMRVVSY